MTRPGSFPLAFIACLIISAALAYSASRQFLDRPGGKQDDQSFSLRRFDPEAPCGPVAVSTVGSLLGKNIPLHEATKFVRCDYKGVSSATELVSGIRRAGLYARPVTLDYVPTLGEGVAMIVHLGGAHWAAAIGRGRTIVVIDPPEDAIEFEQCLERWDGFAVLVAKEEKILDESL